MEKWKCMLMKTLLDLTEQIEASVSVPLPL